MIVDRQELEAAPGVALTLNVDGFGTPEVKRERYQELVRLDTAATANGRAASGDAAGERPDGGRSGEGPALRFPVGLKLFYEEDTDLLGPEQVLGMTPPPDLVVYE
jgi:hypothetical protein